MKCFDASVHRSYFIVHRFIVLENPMLTIPPPQYRKRNSFDEPKRTGTPALVLVLGTYDPKTSVTLGFDREIDISAMDGAQISVSDGAFTGETYTATGVVTVLNPTTVRIRLVFSAAYPGAGIMLNATGA